MEKLDQILQSGKLDFPLGVELLKELAPKNTWIDYLSSAEGNSFNCDLLRAELLKLKKSLPEKPVLKEKEIDLPKSTTALGNALTDAKSKRISFEALPEELQKLYLRRNDLVRQADITKERIRGCQDKAERYNLGLAVLRMWSEVRSIWGKLDAFAAGVEHTSEDLPNLSGLTLTELKALKQKQFVLRSKAKAKANTSKFNYHDTLIRHINERISNVQLR